MPQKKKTPGLSQLPGAQVTCQPELGTGGVAVPGWLGKIWGAVGASARVRSPTCVASQLGGFQRPSALTSGPLSDRLILVTIPSQARSSRFGYSRYTQCIFPFCFGAKLHLLSNVRSSR